MNANLKNVAGWDRWVRIALGVVLLVLNFGGLVSGGLGVVLAIVGFILLLTGIVGFCPIYRLFNFRTNH